MRIKQQPTELWFLRGLLGEQPIYFSSERIVCSAEFERLVHERENDQRYQLALSNYGRQRLVEWGNKGFIWITTKD